jgi:hypothetical protein
MWLMDQAHHEPIRRKIPSSTQQDVKAFIAARFPLLQMDHGADRWGFVALADEQASFRMRRQHQNQPSGESTRDIY